MNNAYCNQVWCKLAEKIETDISVILCTYNRAELNPELFKFQSFIYTFDMISQCKMLILSHVHIEAERLPTRLYSMINPYGRMSPCLR